MNLKWFLDNRTDIHPRVQRFRRILENHLEIPAQRADPPLTEMGNVPALKKDTAGCRIKQTHQRFSQRRFATA